MAAGTEAIRAVGDLAMGQWGLVTTAQARAAGLSSQQIARLADAGVLERLRHGVYRVAGAPPHFHEDLRAAWLALSPAQDVVERLADADVEVVSHRSAAAVHGLGDLDADRLEFTTRTRKQTRDSQVRLHRRRQGAGDWTLVDGLPVTTVLTTIGDLAASRLDGGHLAGVVRDAVTTHQIDVDDVSTVLSPYAHHYEVPLGQGAVLLEQMLRQVGVPASIDVVGRLANPRELSVAERAVERVIDGGAVRKAMTEALDGVAMRVALEQVLDSGAVRAAMERALSDKALKEAIERVIDSPVIRDAVLRAVAAAPGRADE